MSEEANRYVVEGVKLYSITQINELPQPVKTRIYADLVPASLLERFGVDPDTRRDDRGDELVSIKALPGSRSVEIDVRPSAGFRDPLLYLELVDTRLSQIEILLLVVNDPTSPRFETDRDWRGERTKFGTFRRNIPEEIRAMEAGLAPGQVRRGLRLSRALLPRFEQFVERLGHDYYLVEPLAYHTAILFERLGFTYVQGLRKMEAIDQEFRPGGQLHHRLDGSTPFRAPDAWQTVRGRGWAIHDGILEEPYHGIRMYKRVGVHAGVDTFPGGTW